MIQVISRRLAGDKWCLYQRQAATVDRKSRSDDKRGFPKSPAVSLMAGDYQGIIAVVGRMIGWCERIARPPDADLQNSTTSRAPPDPHGRGVLLRQHRT